MEEMASVLVAKVNSLFAQFELELENVRKKCLETNFERSRFEAIVDGEFQALQFQLKCAIQELQHAHQEHLDAENDSDFKKAKSLVILETLSKLINDTVQKMEFQ